MTYSHMGNPTLPSALRGFTSEFGKGSGGSLLLWSPAQLFMDTCFTVDLIPVTAGSAKNKVVLGRLPNGALKLSPDDFVNTIYTVVNDDTKGSLPYLVKRHGITYVVKRLHRDRMYRQMKKFWQC